MGTVVEDIVAPSVRRLAREVFECGSLQSFGTRVSVTRSGRGTPAAHRNVSQIAQEAPLNLGSALLKRNRLEEALAACHVAEEQRP